MHTREEVRMATHALLKEAHLHHICRVVAGVYSAHKGLSCLTNGRRIVQKSLTEFCHLPLGQSLQAAIHFPAHQSRMYARKALL
jgi:hypothetical protein